MWSKFIAIVQIWIGLSFVIALISYIPFIGSAVSGVLDTIVGFIAQIPFYGILMMLLGTMLFIDGIMRVRT